MLPRVLDFSDDDDGGEMRGCLTGCVFCLCAGISSVCIVFGVKFLEESQEVAYKDATCSVLNAIWSDRGVQKSGTGELKHLYSCKYTVTSSLSGLREFTFE